MWSCCICLSSYLCLCFIMQLKICNWSTNYSISNLWWLLDFLHSTENFATTRSFFLFLILLYVSFKFVIIYGFSSDDYVYYPAFCLSFICDFLYSATLIYRFPLRGRFLVSQQSKVWPMVINLLEIKFHGNSASNSEIQFSPRFQVLVLYA